MTRRRRPLLAALASAALAAAPVHPASAQQRPAMPMPDPPPPSQLDRVEAKLDELLRRLPAPPPPPAGPAGSAAAAARPAGPPPGEAPSPAAPSSSAPPVGSGGGAEGHRPGALAVVRPAPAPNAVLAVPPDSVGGFVFSGGTLRLDDLSGRGVRWRGQAGVELQGWLRVREAGRHQVAVDFGSPRAGGVFAVLTCGAALWLEDRQVGQRAGDLVLSLNRGPEPLSAVFGAELEPGLYRLRLWLACGRNAGGGGGPLPATAEVLLKAPSEMNLRALGPADLLHREG